VFVARTHVLLTGDPAIDAGNTSASSNYDQWNVGFPRVSGANADIGAYELDAGDLIFRERCRP
jgi:hypothetical protein